MDFSFLENLAKQASEISLYDIKTVVNKAKNVVLNLSEIESKVREATNDDAWGASSTVMGEIAQATFNFQLFNEIMPTIYQRFTEKEARQWRQIYKALVLLEFLVKNGSERVIDDARSHLSLIKVLRNFHYTDEAGKDQGINVRNRSRELAELLADLDKVRVERRKAKANRNKYTGVGSEGSGGGPSFASASGSRYGGFGSDSFESGSGRGGGNGNGGSSSFQDTSARSAEFEEYDAGEWESSDRRESSTSMDNGRSTSSSGSRSHRASKATPSIPKAAPPPPKVKEVNLFDFDEEEDAPLPVAKPFTSAPVTSTNLADDDFDDFQSGPGISVVAPVARPPSNFDLLDSVPSLSAAPSQPVYKTPSMQPTGYSAFNSTPMQPASSTPSMLSSTTAKTPTTISAAKKPVDDFSDLFSFGGATTAAKPAGPKVSMATLAQQSRESSLFGNGQTKKQPEMSGWDSLI